METVNAWLSGIAVPVILLAAGVYFGAKMKFFFLFHPVKLMKNLSEASVAGGISPFRALTQALAGTLGVGNMTGVAAAICAGGAGAVFWMWVSAFLAMSVKYFEVALAVVARRKDSRGYYGGSMYYIRDIFKARFPLFAKAFSAIFAILCIFNSLITGNILQVNSASGAFSDIPPAWIGAGICFLAVPVIAGSAKRVSAVTLGLIPLLSGIYTALSLIIIISGFRNVQSVFIRIFNEAFSLRAAGGGAGGFLIANAIRYGTVRGIISNEAGMGTSPTAHAGANTKSPHHQGCFGIFEVFADTIVLCTLTALVILLSDGIESGLYGIQLTLYAFSFGAGPAAGIAVAISVILFAYATVICQAEYGIVALKSLTDRSWAVVLYIALSGACCLVGAVISAERVWQMADILTSVMTVLNILCLLYACRKGYLARILKKLQ